MNEKYEGYGHEDYMKWILQRLHPEDFDLLYLLRENGAMDKRRLRRELTRIFEANPEEIVNTFRRCKSYGVVQPLRRGTNYLYDITKNGIEAFDRHNEALSNIKPSIQAK